MLNAPIDGQSNSIPAFGAADFIVIAFNEEPGALRATIAACAAQDHPISKIIVVDDGSSVPVSITPESGMSRAFQLIRLEPNKGISAARNAGINQSDTAILACVNTEVLPTPDWLSTCSQYLSQHAKVGACYTKTLPARPRRLLTRWRMRFQEPHFPKFSGPTPFATGHAVLFRRDAINAAGGYDERFRKHHEDSDICERLWRLGWETHYIAESYCISIQKDGLVQLAKKQLRDSAWYSPEESSLPHLYFYLTRWAFVRVVRNIIKVRIFFVPIDIALWVTALWVATTETILWKCRTRKWLQA
jgi:cellulose synthase/poly-beta-1,6-N-acetylglucosamine synthase-like glycosyltransferase